MGDKKLATISAPEKAARYNRLLDPKRSTEIQRYLAVNEPGRYSMLRTSVLRGMASVIGDPPVRIEPAEDDQRPAGAPSRMDTERVPLRTRSHLGNATVEFAPNHPLYLHLFNTKQRLQDIHN